MRYLPLFALLFGLLSAAEPEYPKMGPDIYDTKANGVVQIAEAIAKAQSQNKRVLLDLGANWCIWCRRLHELFEKNAEVKKVLEENFVVVLIDVNHRGGLHRNDAVNDRYDNPIQHGLPVLLVLDSDGKHLTTQETGALEDGKAAHDPEKVITFLKQWSPKR